MLATLYTVLGKEGNQIAENLDVTDLSEPDSLIDALTNYFEPQKNIIFERYLFNTAIQEENESIDQYLNGLRKLATTCDYGAFTNQLICDRLAIGISDQAVRSRLLREKTLTLEGAVDMVRATETSKNQLKQMERQGESSIHSVRNKSSYNKNKRDSKIPITCKYCGKSHKPRECPAFGRSVRNVIRRIILLKCVNRQRQRKITPQNKTRK